MDPLACWKRLCEALYDGDIDEAIEAANDLETWRTNGGAMDMLPDAANQVASECCYCGYLSNGDSVPAASNDEVWKELAAFHAPTCEWILTRAHRRKGV